MVSQDTLIAFSILFIVLASLELWAISQSEFVRWGFAIVDFVLVVSLLLLLRVLASLGYRWFRHEEHILSFMKLFCKKYWSAVDAAERSLRAVKNSQGSLQAKKRIREFADELVLLPFAARIFSVVGWRIVVILVTVPAYVALLLIMLGWQPVEHSFVAENYSMPRSMVHGIAAVRDATTSFLGGSNTEHPQTEGENTTGSKGNGTGQGRVTLKPHAFRGLAWEFCLFGGIVVYLYIILIFLPSQLNTMATMLHELTGRVFWIKYLKRSIDAVSYRMDGANYVSLPYPLAEELYYPHTIAPYPVHLVGILLNHWIS